MNIRILITASLCLAAGLCAQQSHAPAAPGSACSEGVQALLAEIRSLRIELLRERLERTQLRISDLERQVAKAETDRVQADGFERAQITELAELQERLARPGVSPEDRTDLEQYRNQIINAGAPRIAEAAATNARLESELRQRLAHDQRVSRELREQLRASGADASRD
jgi:hypothetical protein